MNRKWLHSLRIILLLWVGLVFLWFRRADFAAWSSAVSRPIFIVGIILLVLSVTNLVLCFVVLARKYRVIHLLVGVIPSAFLGIAALLMASHRSISVLQLSLGVGAAAATIMGARIARRIWDQERAQVGQKSEST